jgi:hypothetical protein
MRILSMSVCVSFSLRYPDRFSFIVLIIISDETFIGFYLSHSIFVYDIDELTISLSLVRSLSINNLSCFISKIYTRTGDITQFDNSIQIGTRDDDEVNSLQ